VCRVLEDAPSVLSPTTTGRESGQQRIEEAERAHHDWHPTLSPSLHHGSPSVDTILNAYLRLAAEQFGDVPRSPGPDKIVEFEKKHKIQFCERMRAFLLEADGTGEENLNSVGQSLWRLEEFTDMHKFCKEFPENRYVVIGDEYYHARLFAFDAWDESRLVSIVNNEGVHVVADISNCKTINDYVFHIANGLYID
jgi:hypothetical protein